MQIYLRTVQGHTDRTDGWTVGIPIFPDYTIADMGNNNKLVTKRLWSISKYLA